MNIISYGAQNVSYDHILQLNMTITWPCLIIDKCKYSYTLLHSVVHIMIMMKLVTSLYYMAYDKTTSWGPYHMTNRNR